MEEEKAAAYYDELTRKGEGAARFKRGLGFSSCDDQHDAVPQRGTTFVSPCSSFLSSFVRASSPTTASKLEKESQLQPIQHKLKKKPEREARLPPERVKAKMKLQLAEAAEKDPTTGPGWERFEFDKDAPVDDDEIEVAEDDASLVKHIGQSFRFSAIEVSHHSFASVNRSNSNRCSCIAVLLREEQLKAAHDEAIFGTSTASLSVTADSEPEEENLKKDSNDNAVATGLLSEKVLAKQPGSWRDRVRKA
ncbi:hypothetical protein GOBAR_DD31307 [Gossypium barbadense]|nr:hypothetical protein GOBAR_DD31307 [Gossypium barbadense]